MQVAESHRHGEAIALGELPDSLAGKAHDDVCGYPRVRDHCPHKFDSLREPGGVIAPAHRPQNGVAATLQRDVEVGAEAWVFPQFQQLRSDLLGLQRGHSQPVDGCFGQDPSDQFPQTGPGEVETVSPQLGAGQHRLPAAGASVDLGDDLLGRYAPLPAPYLWHDAVGADLVASLLNLNHGPASP